MGLKDRLIMLLGGVPRPKPVGNPVVTYLGGSELPDDHPIAKLLMRNAGKGATSIEKDSEEGRMITAWLAEQRTGSVPPPRDEKQAAALDALGGDVAGTRLEWSVWDRERKLLEADMPGWTACRFYNRVGPDAAMGVFGAVKGGFGIWRQPYRVCDHDHDEQEEIVLPALTHLATGLAMGTFTDMPTAMAGAEALGSLDWSVMPAADYDDEVCHRAWVDRAALARKTLAFHGIVTDENRHAHERYAPLGFTIPIYVKSDLAAGKPEKLS